MSPIKITIKSLVLLFGFIFFYFILFTDITNGLDNIPSIEVKNECVNTQNNNGFDCTRQFEVPKYIEAIKKDLGKTFQNQQTTFQKLAGIAPDIFKYSLSFEDSSNQKIWRGQNSEVWENPPRGQCPFPKDFNETEFGGKYKANFGLTEVPSKLEELATSLNNCKQNLYILPEDITDIERNEKYNPHIKLSILSHIYLIILSISLTAITVKIAKFLWKFIIEDFSK